MKPDLWSLLIEACKNSYFVNSLLVGMYAQRKGCYAIIILGDSLIKP